jgi:hypothetical protein
VAGNGPKDTEPTPVVPRYYSPGLPIFAGMTNSKMMQEARFNLRDAWALAVIATASIIGII